jgi:hypothetical protein
MITISAHSSVRVILFVFDEQWKEIPHAHGDLDFRWRAIYFWLNDRHTRPVSTRAFCGAESRAVFTGNGHGPCSFNSDEASSMSIACENYH